MAEFVSTKLALIKTLLETVSGIKNVYIRDRLTIDPSEFRELFGERVNKAKRVQVWMVGRDSISSVIEQPYRDVSFHTFVIRGFLAFNDKADSWTEFQEMIDKIRRAFRNDTVIWDVCETTVQQAIQARLIGYQFFGEVLCHYCELALNIEEHVNL